MSFKKKITVGCNSEAHKLLSELIDIDGIIQKSDIPNNMDIVTNNIHLGGDTPPQSDVDYADAISGANRYPYGVNQTVLTRENTEIVTTDWPPNILKAYNDLMIAISAEGESSPIWKAEIVKKINK